MCNELRIPLTIWEFLSHGNSFHFGMEKAHLHLLGLLHFKLYYLCSMVNKSNVVT